MLRKKNQQKRQWVYLVNRGVQIATRPTWAFKEVPQKAVPSGGSNLARLGELGGKL